MAALEQILSQARRHVIVPNKPHSSLSLLLLRHLSSYTDPATSSPDLQPPPPPATPKPVSYAVKPKPEPEPEPNPDARAWTREDFRYVKNVPQVASASPASRVAPLPEDREEKKDEEVETETETEGRRIEAEQQRRRANRLGFRGVREEESVPYPVLIKRAPSVKKEKVIYDLQEAIRQVKANAKANFVESVEIHVNLAPELRRTDLKVDSIATLPHGTGKAVKIAVFADGSAAEEARAAGADIVGGLELVDGIKSGSVKVDFDVCVTTQQFVPHLQKLGSVLRSRMPSKKAGTVTDDVAMSVKEAKRVVKINKKDKAAVVHAGVGKVNFPEDALRENIGAFVNALLLAKPAGLKKSSKYAGYVNSVHICSSMGPGFPISMQSLSAAADRYNKMQLN